MTTTMTIAYLLLPVFAVMTISMIINARRYKQIMKDCIEHPALLGFTSMVTLFGGTAIVLYHNTWTADRTTAISVIGWLMVLKGAIRLLFPEMAKRMILWAANKNAIYFGALICAIISIILFTLIK